VHAAALRGDELRIGWRVDYGQGAGESLQHWANAAFVTVFEGETFAQIGAIHRQHPQRGKAHVALNEGEQTWHASIGTNGKLVGRFSDGDTPHEMSVAQTWCLSGEAALRCTVPRWRSVYRHDADGKALEGSKAALFEVIRRGDPIRLSWGMSTGPDGAISVEHSADTVFVTIASRQEAYAQLIA
jgi:hypothetical protein